MPAVFKTTTLSKEVSAGVNGCMSKVKRSYWSKIKTNKRSKPCCREGISPGRLVQNRFGPTTSH